MNIKNGNIVNRTTILDNLLQFHKEGLIDDEGIVEEIDTFTLAGHDTIAGAMNFSIFQLGQHPDAQDRILEEIDGALNENAGAPLTFEEINRMDYLNRFIKEILRLYPPAQYISRELSEDVQFGNENFPKGSMCQIHIYDIHQDIDSFEQPEKFDPDRFLPENSLNRNSFAYMPFSAGIRNCIGQKSAYIELKVILTSIVQNFKVVPITKAEDIVLTAGIVLGTKDPIKVQFHSRVSSFWIRIWAEKKIDLSKKD